MAPFEVESGEATASGAFAHHESVLKIPSPARDPSEDSLEGRSRAVMLRCCGSTSARTEVLMTLQVFRVFFDFFPTEAPPRGARSLLGKKEAAIIAKHGLRLQAQALDRAAARRSGTEGRNPPANLLDPVTGTLVETPPPRSTMPPTSSFGRSETHICQHRYLFQRHDTGSPEPTTPSELHIKLWGDIRSSMAGSGPSNWAYDRFAAHEERSTVAHELGHALGLPDEYGETRNEASLAGVTFVDEFVPEGRPYMFDVHDQDDAFEGVEGKALGQRQEHSSMMTHSGVVRARQFRAVAAWARDAGALPECVSIRTEGEHWADEHGLPANPYKPAVRKLDLTVGGASLFDAFLYLIRGDTHLGRRFRDDKDSADALLVLRTKIAIDHEENFTSAKRFADKLRETMQRLSRKLLATELVNGPQGSLRLALVWSPRILWRRYPRLFGDPSKLNIYLEGLSYNDNSGKLHKVDSLLSAEESKAALEAELETNLIVQRDQEDRIDALKKSGFGDLVIEPERKKLEASRRRELEIRAELDEISSGLVAGFREEKSREQYEALTQAISADHPPHIVFRAQTAFRVALVDAEATPRLAECPVALDTPGIRHRFQAVCAQLLGASTGHTRLTKEQQRALVAKALEGSEFGVDP